MKIFFILLTLIIGLEFNEYDSSVSLSESVCIECNCNTRTKKRTRCLPRCTPCLKQFKEIEYILTTLDPSNITVVSNSFNQIQNEQAVVAKAAQDNVAVQINELKTGLEKEIVGCIEKELKECFEKVVIVIDKEKDDQSNSVNTSVKTAVSTILSLIQTLGSKEQKDILEEIRKPKSLFQLAVIAAIEQVATENSQFVLTARDSMKKESSNILSKQIHKIMNWIKEVFRIQSKLRGVFEILKKQLEDILKAGETSLLNGLVQTNKKVIESIYYVLRFSYK